MGDVINLNKFRKARDKAAAAETAQANRAKHGRTKADRQTGKANADKAEAALSGHKRAQTTDDEDAED